MKDFHSTVTDKQTFVTDKQTFLTDKQTFSVYYDSGSEKKSLRSDGKWFYFPLWVVSFPYIPLASLLNHGKWVKKLNKQTKTQTNTLTFANFNIDLVSKMGVAVACE